MAKTNIIQPYSSVPYIPLNEVGGSERNGAQFLSNVKQLSVGFGSRVFRVDRDGMWAGAETFAGAPWSVDWDGNMIANSITISGYIPTGGALTDIGAGNITNTYIGTNAISTGNIQANAITATKINVSSLSAISANIGSVTSGTITGALIRTSSSGSRVEIDDTTDSIKIYDASGDIRMELYDQILAFNDSSELQVAALYASDASNFLINGGKTTSNILINAGVSASVILGTGGNVYMTLTAGNIEVGTTMNMNGFDINTEGGDINFGTTGDIIDIRRINFTASTTNPSANGQMRYYNSGGSEGLRMQFGGSDFQFDATGV